MFSVCSQRYTLSMEALAQIAAQIAAAESLEVRDRIPRLARLRDQLTAHIAEDTLVLEETGGLEADRFKNPGNWLAKHTGMSKSQAQRTVSGGRLSREFDAFDTAVSDGSFTTDHLTQMARLVPHSHTPFRAQMFGRDHKLFVDFARELSFRDFAKACDAWRMACDDADPDAQAPEEKDLGIVFSDNRDGTTSIKGLILTTDAIALKTALLKIADALLRKEHQTNNPNQTSDTDGTDDTDDDAFGSRVADAATETEANHTEEETAVRCEPVPGRGQRYRLALALGILSALANTAPKDGKTPEPLIVVHIDWDTFNTEADRYANLGPPPDPADIFRDGYLCETTDGEPISPAQAFRLALQHQIQRCVIDAASLNVDLGRKQRLFKGAARDAVLYRDRGCTETGCDTTTRWCDTDHIC